MNLDTIGKIVTNYFEVNDSAIWITPGTYILTINYSVSGSGDIGMYAYNFTDAESVGYAVILKDPVIIRGDIIRILETTKSIQFGLHVTGSMSSVSSQITSIKLK